MASLFDDVFADGCAAAVRIALLLPAAYLTFKILYGLFSYVSIYFLPAPWRLDRYIHRDDRGRDPWALVTGASDGVGTQLAQLLAAAGLNVVLHGRNTAKLQRVRDGLATAFPERSFRVLVADASTTGRTDAAPPAAVDDLVQQNLADLHLTVLINNAGGGPTNPTYLPLSESSSERLAANVHLNAVFPMLLTARALPLLIRSSPALVMNIGSLADQGFPLLAPYASAKTFLMTLTTVVRRELSVLADQGQRGAAAVEIVAVRLGSVTGVTHNANPPTLFEPDARTMARASLDRIGCGRAVVTGYWPHALQDVLTWIPLALRERIFKKVILQRRDAELAQLAKAK